MKLKQTISKIRYFLSTEIKKIGALFKNYEWTYVKKKNEMCNSLC